MSMAQSVGCNIPEDLALGLGKLAMEQLRHAVFVSIYKHKQHPEYIYIPDVICAFTADLIFSRYQLHGS